MKGLPRSGSPMMKRTWRTPSVPELAEIGGGTAVGIGLVSDGLSRCACDFIHGEVMPRSLSRRSMPAVEPSGGLSVTGSASRRPMPTSAASSSPMVTGTASGWTPAGGGLSGDSPARDSAFSCLASW